MTARMLKSIFSNGVPVNKYVTTISTYYYMTYNILYTTINNYGC